MPLFKMKDKTQNLLCILVEYSLSDLSTLDNIFQSYGDFEQMRYDDNSAISTILSNSSLPSSKHLPSNAINNNMASSRATMSMVRLANFKLYLAMK